MQVPTSQPPARQVLEPRVLEQPRREPPSYAASAGAGATTVRDPARRDAA